MSVDEALVCDHSNESYWAVLSCGTVYYAVQGGSIFKSVDETLVCDNSIEQDFHVVLLQKVVFSFYSVKPSVWPFKR